MKAFVAGATGQTGKRIVQELVRRQIPVCALVRNLDKAKEILPPETEIIVGDVLKPESYQQALASSTVLLCATGATPSLDPTGPYQIDYQGTKNLVEAAKVAQIQQFVLVSSLCASKLFHPLNLFWLVLYWKKQAEVYIQNSGLTYTIVRPGGLLSQDNTDPLVMSSADTLFEGRIPRTKVAEVCVESLMIPEAQNKIVEIIAQPEAVAKDWSQLFSNVT